MGEAAGPRRAQTTKLVPEPAHADEPLGADHNAGHAIHDTRARCGKQRGQDVAAGPSVNLGARSSRAGQLVCLRAAETAGVTGSRSQPLTRPPPGTLLRRAASGTGNRPRSDTASVRA
jgi:hypothetical protein